MTSLGHQSRIAGHSVLTIAASKTPVPDEGKSRQGFGTEDGLAALQNIGAQSREFEAAMIDRRHIHRTEHPVGHVCACLYAPPDPLYFLYAYILFYQIRKHIIAFKIACHSNTYVYEN